MKNLKFYGMLLSVLITYTSYSQTKTDSVTLKKNEISVNVLPVINLLTSAEDMQYKTIPVLHLNYKHLLKNNFALRFGFSLFSNPKRYQAFDLKEIKGGNSQLNIKYYHEEGSGIFQGNIGLEKRWGKAYIKQFAGLDLGYSYYNSSKREMFGIRDSINYFSSNYYTTEGSALLSDSTINLTRKNVHSVLITPFYGIIVNVSRRCYFSGQIGFDIVNSIDKFTSPSYQSFSYGFNGSTSGVSTNILFGIRF